MSGEVRQGGCRCGRVRFETTGEPLLTMACHCTGCKHMSASAYSLSEGYPSAAFRLVRGEPVIGGIHGATRHHHCDYCKSWLYTEPEGVPDFVNVRSTMFDDVRTEPPFVETYVGEALPWAGARGQHRYGTLPATDEWPQLIREFAGRNAAWAKEEFNP
ncbi:MAG TPA: GFA family protein [Sphingomicrobium sp.]|nr:GFA family protein [Sphingomicrobium sp.]